MFLENTSVQIKNIEGKFEYILYVSDADECKKISIGTDVIPDHEIIAYGDPKTIDLTLAEILMPEPKFILNKINNAMTNSYKCWCCDKLGTSQIIAHLTALNSWECLMQTIGNPSNIVVVQHKIKPDEGIPV